MAAVTFNVSELMLAGGLIYRAAYATALPLKTVALGAAWPAAWEIVGLTSAPTVIGYTFDAVNAGNIQQATGVVRRGKDNEAGRLETRLAQAANLKTLQLAYNGGTFAAVAAIVGTPGYEEFKIGGERYMTPFAWGWEGVCHNDDTGVEFPIRGFIYRGTTDQGGTLEFDKTKFADGAPLMVGGMIDMTRTAGDMLMTWYRITTPALP